MTKDRWTDGQAENNRAPPTFVGGALIKTSKDFVTYCIMLEVTIESNMHSYTVGLHSV